MITAIRFKEAFLSGANNLARNRQALNELNVFPVPDGDTGTNMGMTMASASEALHEADIDEGTPVDSVASTAAEALLEGARGNSGVILSMLFHGFAKGCEGKESLDGRALAAALKKGVESAYKAVLHPTEGTILTVSRMAADAAEKASLREASSTEVLEAALKQAEITLAETPELLPMLKKAGVVDAGGKGYVTVLEGMLTYLQTGRAIDPPSDEDDAFLAPEDPVPLSEDEITFTYCTEILLRCEGGVPEEAVDTLTPLLSSMGDSLVIAAVGELLKIHVHTDRPGKAIDEAMVYGDAEKIKVENMRLQFRQRQSGGKKPEKSKRSIKKGSLVAEPTEECGMVAVAAGDGLAALFSELGCAQVVSGGQTMNPSAEELLRACLMTPAKTVFLLPNNKNIIMAAEQAALLAPDREIRVIPTKTIPQGIAAAMSFVTESSADEMTQSMNEAKDRVKTGQITFAARDSDFDGRTIKKGQFLALKENKLSFVDNDLRTALFRLTDEIFHAGEGFLTLIYGEGVTEAEAERVCGILSERFPEADICPVFGGQPVYHYILSAEQEDLPEEDSDTSQAESIPSDESASEEKELEL